MGLKNAQEKVRVLLARHPKTIENVRGVVAGNHAPLHPDGYEQIEEMAQYVGGLDIDRIYAGTSERHRLLAERLGEVVGVDVNYDGLFNEISNGELAGLPKKVASNLRMENPSSWIPNEGESLDDLFGRGFKARKMVYEQAGKPLVVSSGMTLKGFVGGGLRMQPHDAIERLGFSNCAISEVELSEGDGFHLRYLNDRHYLKTL